MYIYIYIYIYSQRLTPCSGARTLPVAIRPLCNLRRSFLLSLLLHTNLQVSSPRCCLYSFIPTSWCFFSFFHRYLIRYIGNLRLWITTPYQYNLFYSIWHIYSHNFSCSNVPNFFRPGYTSRSHRKTDFSRQ
jgi:hypothetical protein